MSVETGDKYSSEPGGPDGSPGLRLALTGRFGSLSGDC